MNDFSVCPLKHRYILHSSHNYHNYPWGYIYLNFWVWASEALELLIFKNKKTGASSPHPSIYRFWSLAAITKDNH